MVRRSDGKVTVSVWRRWPYVYSMARFFIIAMSSSFTRVCIGKDNSSRRRSNNHSGFPDSDTMCGGWPEAHRQPQSLVSTICNPAASDDKWNPNDFVPWMRNVIRPHVDEPPEQIRHLLEGLLRNKPERRWSPAWPRGTLLSSRPHIK
jgi:hypothetical protein